MKDSKINTLPGEFFENLYNLENKFYETKSEETIQELLNQYEKAINYYSSIKDKRSFHYRNRMDLFISNNPEVALVRRKQKKKGDTLKTVPRTPEISRKAIKRFVSFHVTSKKEANDLINLELSKQESQFKLKLKRSKSRANSMAQNYIPTSPSSQKTASEIDDLGPIIIEQNDQKDKVLGSRQQKKLHEIKKTIINFINQFNSIFSNEYLADFASKISELMNEKFSKYSEIEKEYENQIQEIQLQRTEGEEYLELIYESLQEEKQNELDNIEDIYNTKILNLQNDFIKSKTFRDKIAVSLNEEQFKLEIINKIQELVCPEARQIY